MWFLKSLEIKKFFIKLLFLIAISKYLSFLLIFVNLISDFLFLIPNEITLRFLLKAFSLCNLKKLSSAFKTTKPSCFVLSIISDLAIAISLMFLKFLAWYILKQANIDN